jgi:hypothetical protein
VLTNNAVDLSIGSEGIEVSAAALCDDGGPAIGNAVVDIVQDNLVIKGNVDVSVVALNGLAGSGGGGAEANANVQLHSVVGNATVLGHVDAEAFASDAGSGAAVANALTGITASGNVLTFSLHDRAAAVNLGSGTAHANALASVTAHHSASILGDAEVLAIASNEGGLTGPGIGASADARLNFHNAQTVTVQGIAGASANAINHGQGSVNAHASIGFDSAGSVTLGGVRVGVGALNLGSGAGGPGAHADAAFTLTNNAVHLTIGSEGIGVGAFAVTAGQGKASATALVDIAQNNLEIFGNVQVLAIALNGLVGTGGGNAQAIANVHLVADAGSALVAGNIDVIAAAEDLGAGNAVAQGLVDISASAGEGSGGRTTIGSLSDRALALDGGAGSANAQAQAYLQGDTVTINGNAEVAALADNTGAAGGNDNLAASADAELGFGNPHGKVNAQIAGDVQISAVASNLGAGKVQAHGAFEFDDATTLAANGITIAVAALNKRTAGTGGATANASFIASPGQHLAIHGLNLQAIASSHGGQGASANANAQITQSAISILGDITLNAAPFDGSGGEGGAKALANLGLHASSGSVTVGGKIDVEARASGGGSAGAQASALVGITASAGEGAGVTLGGLFDAAGAHTFGSGAARAAAIASIDPPGVLHILGNAAVIASATNLGTGHSGSIDASAQAHLHLAGFQSLKIDGNAVVDAFATNLGLGGVVASGTIGLGGGGVAYFGGIQIAVAAANKGSGIGSPDDPGPKPGALAVAGFRDSRGGAGLTVGSGGIDVQALASSLRLHGAIASADVGIRQSEVTVLGGITVSANAVNGSDSVIEEAARFARPAPGGATARALLNLEADSGSVTVDGRVDVEARAFDQGNGAAVASALTNTFASAGEGVTGGVTLGGLTNFASALNSGGQFARAKALANIDPPGSVHILGNASVAAHAINAGSGNGALGASAVAQLNFTDFKTVTVDGNAVASAAATNFAGGGVNAHGSIGFGGAGDIHLGGVKIHVVASNSGTGHSGANAMAAFVENNTAVHLAIVTGGVDVFARAGSFGGGGASAVALVDIVQKSVVIGGGVAVEASAGNNLGGSGGARAIANLTLTATAGDVTVGGPVIAQAFDFDLGTHNAVASAQEHITAGGGGGNVTIGGLFDSVTAENFGGGYAKAVGAANVDASGAIHIVGGAGVFVRASNGPGTNGGGIGASANGQLNFAGANTVTVDFGAAVEVSATNSGASGVKARGAMNFGAAQDINLGGAEVEVSARDKSTAHNGSAAKASAAFVQNNGAVHLTIGSSGLIVKAVASSQGHAGASANALADIQQGDVSIGGGVDVSAFATGGPNVGQKSKAKANLVLDATTGNIAVGGSMEVSARASSNGLHGALGSALADLTAAHKVSVGGFVDVEAAASTHALGNVTLASSVKANAELAVHAASSAHFGGSVEITAEENARMTPIGQAIAKGDIQANHGVITFDGNVLVQANTLGGAGAGNVQALASLDAVAGNNITFVNNAGLTINAHGVSSRSLGVTAIALAGLTAAHNVSVGGNIAVLAAASTHASGIVSLAARVKADAELAVHAGSSALFGGAVAVEAQENAKTPIGQAIAKADIQANAGAITFDNNVLVQANALGGAGAGSVQALASLDAVAGSKVALANDAGLTVNAHAVSSGTHAVTAIAQGILQANAIQQAAANGQGNMAISASAIGMGNGIDDAMAVALFSADADVGGILLQNNVDIHANAVDPGAGNMLAFAYGNLTANSGITVDGDIALTADLTGNGLAAGSFHLASLDVPVTLYRRFGSASLTVDANHGNVALGGVSLLASANLTATGTPHGGHVAPGTAGAWTVAHVTAGTGNVLFGGPVHLGANAADMAHGAAPVAYGHLVAKAGHNLTAGSVSVNAAVVAPTNAHNAFALALGQLSASGSQLTAGHLGLNAQANAGAGVTGDVGAVADLTVNGHAGQVTLGSLSLDANALDLGSSGAALAYANADVLGGAGVTVNGLTSVTAELKTKTKGSGVASIDVGSHIQPMNYGQAFAGLTIDPSAASAGIKTGAITVDANADLLAVSGPYNGGARTYVNLDASHGAVTIGGPFLATANVVSQGQGGGNASANATTDIHGAKGVKLGNATVTANASAQGGGLGQNAKAQSLLKITADNGNITGKSMQDNATALHLGTGGKGVVTAKAMSLIDATNGNVTLTGDLVLATAHAPNDAASQGTANANLILHAGKNISVTGGGLKAEADALVPFGQARAKALVKVTAGQNISIKGNETALAVATGSHSGQKATANILDHAGTAGFGQPSIFGNVMAIASADPINDQAHASVNLIANRILIVGRNPTAIANAGSLSAFAKSRFGKRVIRHGHNGTTAAAQVTLNADKAGIIIINDSSTGVGFFKNPNGDALQAMPIYDQIFPSGSLYAVPVTIDGKPCGTLGGLAAKGPASCGSPINISDVVDGP